MEKKKIAVVLTGGTIGSRTEQSVIDVNKESPYLLLQMYQENYGGVTEHEVEFEVFQPYSILSENLVPEYWSILWKQLSSLDLSEYTGVIVTHGSDTLPYTAAFLSILLHRVTIPLILVASNYELKHPKSNGLRNFASAVSYINGGNPRGVYCIFENNKGESVVYLGSRIQEADSYLDQFVSFGGMDFGHMRAGKFELFACDQNPKLYELKEDKAIETNKSELNKSELNKSELNNIDQVESQKKEFVLNETIKNKIMVLTPYPGFSYDNISLDQDTKAILHMTYHSGTACTDGECTSMIRFLDRCKEMKVDVYVASVKRGLNDNYRTVREIMDRGGCPLYDMGKEVAYAKLVIAYNQTGYSPRKFMEEIFFHESILMHLDRCMETR